VTVAGKTISEKILAAKSGRDACAGDIVVCDVDRILGTDASGPMAIDYFDKMGGTRVPEPAHVVFALDHYSPPSTATTRAFHDEVRSFGARHGIRVLDVGEGISHQVVVERGEVLPGELVIGADSHTVTCGALNLFATGVGSSDLAAAMITGQIWLRVPESIKVLLVGRLKRGVAAKDAALALVAALGAEGGNYQTLEFHGGGIEELSMDERMVFTNLAVETGAKAAIFPADGVMVAYVGERTSQLLHGVAADPDARYSRELTIDLSTMSPRVALPHAPDNVVAVDAAVGTPIQMVFLGTCTGGRVSDFHEALRVLEQGGGRVAAGVHLVVTPASRDIERHLVADGTLRKLEEMGATITTPGCGACCGTSGVVPGDGMAVLSTANRNFKARMGNATAEIYLASPAACAAAALTGRITDPREQSDV
jgi:3-isopropylmalate/(R)-2-methylmalate dehydratase large subunit